MHSERDPMQNSTSYYSVTLAICICVYSIKTAAAIVNPAFGTQRAASGKESLFITTIYTCNRYWKRHHSWSSVQGLWRCTTPVSRKSLIPRWVTSSLATITHQTQIMPTQIMPTPSVDRWIPELSYANNRWCSTTSVDRILTRLRNRTSPFQHKRWYSCVCMCMCVCVCIYIYIWINIYIYIYIYIYGYTVCMCLMNMVDTCAPRRSIYVHCNMLLFDKFCILFAKILMDIVAIVGNLLCSTVVRYQHSF